MNKISTNWGEISAMFASAGCVAGEITVRHQGELAHHGRELDIIAATFNGKVTGLDKDYLVIKLPAASQKISDDVVAAIKMASEGKLLNTKAGAKGRKKTLAAAIR